MTPAQEAYVRWLLTLVVWREARGEVQSARLGVAHVVCNRAKSPSWWGHDVVSCILMPYQFSSFNRSDPNSVKFPTYQDSVLDACYAASDDALRSLGPDPTLGAVYYFDSSLDSHPPAWATDGSTVHTVNLGRLRFYRVNR